MLEGGAGVSFSLIIGCELAPPSLYNTLKLSKVMNNAGPYFLPLLDVFEPRETNFSLESSIRKLRENGAAYQYSFCITNRV